MFENNSKYPRIFIYILMALSVLIFASMFFSSSVVEIFYFVAILIVLVFTLLDKKYGKNLTNHRAVFLLFDIINLFATFAIIYHEYSKHTTILNIFLIVLVVEIIALLLIDIFLISNTFSSNRALISIDLTSLCSMICIFTYFYNVSEFWFAILAVIFEVISIIVKIVVSKFTAKKGTPVAEVKDKNENNSIENIIQSNSDEGDVEE